MFTGCKELIIAPDLPAITLADNCYSWMFYNCTSLTTAPSILPAITLESNCCANMFSGCASLTTAPELPATTLANRCYQRMFYGCALLEKAPELPAPELSTGCYERMFYGCRMMNYIKMLAIVVAEDALSYWVYNISPSGTFIKHPDNDWITTGTSGIPSGWTVETATE